MVDGPPFWCYTMHMLKERAMKIVVKIPQKTRAHFVLFAKDTPFKPKQVENKKAFKRNPKHKGRDNG